MIILELSKKVDEEIIDSLKMLRGFWLEYIGVSLYSQWRGGGAALHGACPHPQK